MIGKLSLLILWKYFIEVHFYKFHLFTPFPSHSWRTTWHGLIAVLLLTCLDTGGEAMKTTTSLLILLPRLTILTHCLSTFIKISLLFTKQYGCILSDPSSSEFFPLLTLSTISLGPPICLFGGLIRFKENPS